MCCKSVQIGINKCILWRYVGQITFDSRHVYVKIVFTGETDFLKFVLRSKLSVWNIFVTNGRRMKCVWVEPVYVAWRILTVKIWNVGIHECSSSKHLTWLYRREEGCQVSLVYVSHGWKTINQNTVSRRLEIDYRQSRYSPLYFWYHSYRA